MARDEQQPEDLYTGPIDLAGVGAADGEESDPETPEITYDEQRYPARPRRLRPRDHLRGSSVRRIRTDPRTANGTNPSYVEWLVRQAMLKDADVARPPALRAAHDVAQRLRAPRCATGHRDQRRVVHGLPDLAHHAARAVVPGGARRRGAVGGVRARRDHRASTPVR